MRKPLLTALLAFGLSTVPALAEWTYIDGGGKTITLPEAPKRIVAHANAAAALIPLGIRPVAIYVDSPVADDMSLKGLDLTGIEIIGEAWGEIDIEKLAAIDPDLIVAEFWPLEKAYSGMEASAAADATLIEGIAPVGGPAQGDSIVTLIADYEALAASLGADLGKPEIAAAKVRFEAARDAFKTGVAAKPDFQALAVWAGTDALYVASPDGSSELSDFKAWGLDIVTPETADDRGYWETLSWENADKYQPDLVMVDDRSATTIDTAKAQPTWTTIKAAAAGAVTNWPAFWMRNYKVYAEQLEHLTGVIAATDEHLSER
ncbi:MAG: ABC transporter substrate-binding protein [Hyphomicrobiales bacterium]|nr:MAG: ABC transporter substrate-binding protein [Hyphomicrobiales bacterium]